jgi:hypothetical protein
VFMLCLPWHPVSLREKTPCADTGRVLALVESSSALIGVGHGTSAHLNLLP